VEVFARGFFLAVVLAPVAASRGARPDGLKQKKTTKKNRARLNEFPTKIVAGRRCDLDFIIAENWRP
jgi:hypothetical protein